MSSRPEGTSLIVFALAMCWNNERDRVRLQMLLNSRPGTRIITVSENLHTVGNMIHFSCDFSTDRGHKSLAARVAEERVIYPNTKIIITLDYYWLPVHYFTRRYGMLWLQSGMYVLLKGGADEIILPNDDGDRHGGESGMLKMLLGGCHPGVQLKFVTLESNPLWLSSNESEINTVLAESRGGDNATNTTDYLSSAHPFLSGTLK
jgi:hypothetical protein